MFGKIIVGTAVLVMTLVWVSASFADVAVLRGSNVTIQDFNKTISTQVPTTSKVCEWQQETSTGEGVLGGAIIGGILGEIFGGGDAGTRNAGAIFGGIVGGDKAGSSGQVKVCKDVTTYSTQLDTVYSHSIATFIDGNKRYQLRFIK